MMLYPNVYAPIKPNTKMIGYKILVGVFKIVIMNLALVCLLIKILKTPTKILYQIILVLGFIGAYTLGYNIIDFYILIIFGLVGLFMKLLDIPAAPLILAVIIGNSLEQNFRMANVSYDSFFGILTASPIAMTFAALTVLSILLPKIL